jgi:hypothetical protein
MFPSLFLRRDKIANRSEVKVRESCLRACMLQAYLFAISKDGRMEGEEMLSVLVQEESQGFRQRNDEKEKKGKAINMKPKWNTSTTQTQRR